MGISLDYTRYLESASTAATRWDGLAAPRPEALYLWYRTSPRPLVPFGNNPVSGQNPPWSVAGMTLVAVDASGRLIEFVALPDPFESTEAASPFNFDVLFDAAGLPRDAFTQSAPRIVPPVFASERRAWEGRVPELPEHVLRVEAAGHAGKPVYFAVTGPWSQSARAPLPVTPFFNRRLADIQALVIPALMLCAAVLARRNVKLGRGRRWSGTCSWAHAK
jgi:hypothetical protein